MLKMVSTHEKNINERANDMVLDLQNGKKIQHKMLNAAKRFVDIQDWYYNSVCEWLDNPKCKLALECPGDRYE